MKVRSYKELRVWSHGVKIVDLTYQITKQFPPHESYTLAAQMRRASISIPSNISEGFVRNHTKEYVQFLYVARGSCAELDTQILIAKNQDYITR